MPDPKSDFEVLPFLNSWAFNRGTKGRSQYHQSRVKGQQIVTERDYIVNMSNVGRMSNKGRLI